MAKTRPVPKGPSVREARRMLADERDAALLYEGLAAVADPDRAPALARLAQVERRHAGHWEQWLAAQGASIPPPPRRPALRTRALVLLARAFGFDAILPLVVRMETQAVDGYDEYAPHLAAEEAQHARELAGLAAQGPGPAIALAEPGHRAGHAGALRAGVFGVNDGLVSNAALVLGVAGGGARPEVIVLAGVAGLVAGAASMAAGEWVSVQSQRELHEREIAHERAELAAFPDEERAELEAIYRAKGLSADEARTVVSRLMEDPEVALDVLVREELGLDPDALPSPWIAAVASFFAFAIGAFVPLVPFLVSEGAVAIGWAVGLAASALFTVGALVSLLTRRSLLYSGARMVLIGALAAGVTAVVGAAVGVNAG